MAGVSLFYLFIFGGEREGEGRRGSGFRVPC